jgi:hypothetical protein
MDKVDLFVCSAGWMHGQASVLDSPGNIDLEQAPDCIDTHAKARFDAELGLDKEIAAPRADFQHGASIFE